MMPIETKPEEKTLSGPELEAAIKDGIQRAVGRRVENIRVASVDPTALCDHLHVEHLRITVEVAGSLKGPKPGAKRKPRGKTPPPSAAA